MFAIVSSDNASADDGYAAVAAGGIVFEKSTAIRMKSEDLYISPDNVRVRFAFVNDTDHDVETVVAFPLPDIPTIQTNPDTIVSTTGEALDIVAFKALVNGQPIKVAIEQKAILKGRDVTRQLQSYGLPVNVVSLNKRPKLPQGKLKQLEAAGLLDSGAYPGWLVRTRYWWRQRFPAHGTTIIEHSYRPMSGATMDGLVLARDPVAAEAYCLTSGQRRALMNLEQENVRIATATETQYVLKTANTWKGPIGHFHMTLDRGAQRSVAVLCWDGDLHESGPTTVEFDRDNFVPTRDVDMVVVTTHLLNGH